MQAVLICGASSFIRAWPPMWSPWQCVLTSQSMSPSPSPSSASAGRITPSTTSALAPLSMRQSSSPRTSVTPLHTGGKGDLSKNIPSWTSRKCSISSLSLPFFLCIHRSALRPPVPHSRGSRTPAPPKLRWIWCLPGSRCFSPRPAPRPDAGSARTLCF